MRLLLPGEVLLCLCLLLLRGVLWLLLLPLRLLLLQSGHC